METASGVTQECCCACRLPHSQRHHSADGRGAARGSLLLRWEGGEERRRRPVKPHKWFPDETCDRSTWWEQIKRRPPCTSLLWCPSSSLEKRGQSVCVRFIHPGPGAPLTSAPGRFGDWFALWCRAGEDAGSFSQHRAPPDTCWKQGWSACDLPSSYHVLLLTAASRLRLSFSVNTQIHMAQWSTWPGASCLAFDVSVTFSFVWWRPNKIARA